MVIFQAEELGLSDQVLPIDRSHQATKNRFIYVNRELCRLPSGLFSFYTSLSSLMMTYIAVIYMSSPSSSSQLIVIHILVVITIRCLCSTFLSSFCVWNFITVCPLVCSDAHFCFYVCHNLRIYKIWKIIIFVFCAGPGPLLTRQPPFSKSLVRLGWREPFVASHKVEDETIDSFFRRRFGDEVGTQTHALIIYIDSLIIYWLFILDNVYTSQLYSF